MKTIITIDYSHSADTEARLLAELEQEARDNPYWNGAAFVIERDDFVAVSDESEDATALMHEIVYPVLKGER